MENDGKRIIGWDIGGANIKAALVGRRGRGLVGLRTRARPYEIWRESGGLAEVLLEMSDELEPGTGPEHAVTITAELSDAFRIKAEGVRFVLDAVERAFGSEKIHPFTLGGGFVTPDRLREDPLAGAATNWLAGALFIAERHPDCILVDMGSTTTDIIPIRNGRPVNRGNTDTGRLSSGELVYTGITRTNPNTVVGEVPLGGGRCRVAAEYFAAMADVYLILGRITPEQYGCPTADGREKTISAARERLARLVCSDGELMGEREIHALALYLGEKQIQLIVEAVFQVMSGAVGEGEKVPLVAMGSGRFLIEEAAGRLGLEVIEPEGLRDDRAAAAFPAVAVSWLLNKKLNAE